jgi:hypothetical protein
MDRNAVDNIIFDLLYGTGEFADEEGLTLEEKRDLAVEKIVALDS